MMRRILILKQWCSGKKNQATFKDLIKVLFSPLCSVRAKQKINKIDKTEEYLIIYFKNYQFPLYYPRGLTKYMLYRVVSEIMHPKDWYYYEVEQTKVNPDDIVVDCGAGEGLFSLSIVNRCKKIYAIEPLPVFIAAMKMTFNKFDNIEIIPVALSDRETKVFISNDGIYSQIVNNKNGIPVKATTIDKLFYDKDIPVSYIKADLEGYEIEMLKGARNTINRYKPKLAISTYHRKEHAGMISSYLKSIDPAYKIRLKGIEAEYGAPVMLHAWKD